MTTRLLLSRHSALKKSLWIVHWYVVAIENNNHKIQSRTCRGPFFLGPGMRVLFLCMEKRGCCADMRCRWTSEPGLGLLIPHHTPARGLRGALQAAAVTTQLQQLPLPTPQPHSLEDTCSEGQTMAYLNTAAFIFFQNHKWMSLTKVLFIWTGSKTIKHRDGSKSYRYGPPSPLQG